MSELWGGRFERKSNELVEKLGESVSFDSRLARFDILGSIAHARMLGEQGIIAKGDARKIISGLKAIDREIDKGTFVWDTALEDVHMNIEAALTARIGDAGKRLHTGRSRNDQVAADMRMWTRYQISVICGRLELLQIELVELAEKHVEVILPGCTHLQHAQPVLFAHHMLAYVEMFSRDYDRFTELNKRINILPLGSAALAGTSYKLNRKMVAEELGFDGITGNRMDGVWDRV